MPPATTNKQQILTTALTALKKKFPPPPEPAKRPIIEEVIYAICREGVPSAVADAAFAVKTDGGTTAVVDGTFGPVILRVTNIKPETTKSFDEVKEELRKQLSLANASQEVINVHDRIEDMLAPPVARFSHRGDPRAR